MSADDDRTPSSRTAAPRLMEERSAMWGEAPPGATFVHSAHAPAGLAPDPAAPNTFPAGTVLPATELLASFGVPFRVFGVDNITLLVNLVRSDLTQLNVEVECSYQDVDAGEWFALYEDEADTGVLVKKTYSIPGTPLTGLYAFRIPVRGKYMRVKLWGASAANSDRAAVRVIRGQDGFGN